MPLRRKRSEAARAQSREAGERGSLRDEEEEEDEWYDLAETGYLITAAAESLGAQVSLGSARLSAIRAALTAEHSGNPFVDTRVLESWCMLAGLDPATGELNPLAVRLFFHARDEGLPEQAALGFAKVLPTSLALWRQDSEFRSEETKPSR